MKQLSFSDFDGFSILLDNSDVHNLIPHRPPILMIDDAKVSWDGLKIKATCLLIKRRHLFAGHFPGQPILPGIYVLEAMAQAGLLLCFFANPSARDQNFVFAGAEKVKWRRPILPRMALTIVVEITHLKRLGSNQAVKFLGKAFCRSVLVAEAKFTGMIG